MIQIGNTIISTELFDEHFTCDLSACKGICCVEGSSGAPLAEEELPLLEEVYPKVEPYLRKEGIASIEANGFFVVDQDGEYTTPLVNNEECAYVIFDDHKIAKCAIDQAYRDGKIAWQKPISCHLYPIRIKALKDFDAVNYHKWHICKPACDCGANLQMPVFRFCKSALTRKYGEEYYSQLEEAYRLYQEMEG